MRFQAVIEGHDVTVCVWDGQPVEYRTDAAPGKVFSSEEAITRALSAYNLSLRKNFTNPTAYRVNHSRGAEEVTVTSLCEGGMEAWIKAADGDRRKVYLSTLFADKAEVETFLAFEARLKNEIAERFKALTAWAPQDGEGGEAKEGD